jgi:hypothetical protein
LRFVSELIDQVGSWRVDLLNEYFIPMDIVEILKLKPSPRLMDDQLAWAPEKDGLFTVKSAYRLAMDESWRTSNESTSISPDGSRKIWDLIWKSNVPPKVQNFAWRLATNSLPTWRNKCRRTLEVTDQCPVCGVEAEDNFHPFVRCTLAVQLWSYMMEVWHLPPGDSIENNGVEWLLTLL